MRRLWIGSLGVSLGILAASVRGDDIQWRPAGTLATPVPMTAPAPAALTTPPAQAYAAVPARAASLGRPIASLGQPMAATAPPVSASPATAATDSVPATIDQNIQQTAFSGPDDATPSPVTRAQSPEFSSGPSLAPPPGGGFGGIPTSPEEKYNSGVVVHPPGGSSGGFGGGGAGGLGGVGSFSGGERGMFQSDHCFDGFISPVTNPFLFEDPRSLTEIRPIFILQGAPSSNWIYHGGNTGFVGTQLRLALTERFSVVVNKLGFVWSDPYNPPAFTGISSEGGFAEFWISPKYTFLRNESSGTLGAVGVMLQVPTGDRKVFQDTGSLSLVLPYISMGQNFGGTSYGSFNALGTFGYSFGTTHARSDYLYLSTHLDYDILGAHRFYPLVEMNYFNYTEAGNARNFGFEGRDLFNYGSQGVSGRNNLTIAPGFRYKACEAIQTGVAVEFPLVGTRDILDYRLTWDFIFRY